MRDQLSDRVRARWVWVAGAVLPLAIVGCAPTQQAGQPGPSEQVAGARQEDSETVQVIRESGLPEAFFFGGRIWRGHQVHRADAGDVAAGAGAEPGAANTPGAATAPGAAGETAAGPNEGQMGDYIPLPNMTVQGHQIFRKAGVDEAVTDNIYLQAQAGAAGAATPPAAGTTPGEEGAAGAADAAQMTFVEYDAANEPLADLELSQILQQAGLPQTVSWNNRNWTAAEMQVYDPDIFDEFKPVAQPIDGHTAFQDDDESRVFLMGEFTPDASMAGGGADAGTAAGDTPGTGAAATTPPAAGPIFVRYETGDATPVQ